MEKRMKRKLAAMLAMTLGLSMAVTACGDSSTGTSIDEPAADTTSSDAAAGESGTDGQAEPAASSDAEVPTEPAELTVFVAASLNDAMTELSDKYMQMYPNVQISLNADSSETLMTQIEEGAPCDLFFPASEIQMNQMKADGWLIDGTREDVLKNQLVVITWKGSGTKVTGLDNLQEASSIALAEGNVPAGHYTRNALTAMGVLSGEADNADYEAEDVSKALGGVTVSEQDNVSKVLQAVAEGSCEVGTAYLSDVNGHEDKVEILEKVSTELTGDITYPIGCILNHEKDTPAQKAAANAFETYLLSSDAAEVFAKYGFEPLRGK